MPVASPFAAWLKAEALYSTSSGGNGSWGDKAKDSTVITPLANEGDAAVEADRQASFLSGPLARDTHIVKGARADLIGKVVSIEGDRLGYVGGSNAFVIRAAENDANGTTQLTVLKRLA